MKHWKLLLTLPILLVLLGLGAYVLNTMPTPTSSSHTIATQEVAAAPTVDGLLKLVNEERAKKNVAPLTIDERLNHSAQMKADDMLTNNYFNHVSPKTGKHGYEYIGTVGISCSKDGESITQNTVVNDSKHAVDAWIKSPLHHAAMIDPGLSLTGFGISGNYIVEHFCQAK